jgi:competence protein ComEC
MLFKVLSPKNRLMRWGWGVTAMSVAAQLGTAPLVMYYFSNFSVYFLVANLAVSVLVPLILYVAVLMVVFALLSSIQQGIVWCLNGLVDGLNGLAECTSGLPGATFSLQGFGVMEVLTFYTLLLFVVLFAKDRRPKWLISALVALFSMLALRLFVLCR